MQEKTEFIKNSINILNNLYKDKIEIVEDENYIINNSTELKTKFDFKKYLRDIISSNNKNVHDDIQGIIRLKYQLTKSELITLKEVFPNIDLFISTYIRLLNENIKITITNYTYEELLYHMVELYINHMREKQNKEAFMHITDEEKKLNEEIEVLEEKLDKYLIVKKNRFYYETYLKSIEYESETYNESKEILELNLKNINKEIVEKEKELQKLENKKIIFHKKERINTYNHLINELIDEKEKNIDELQKIETKDKEHPSKNKDSFQEYVKDIDLKTYEEYYKEYKDVDAKELLNEINTKKKKLNQKIEQIAISDYPEIHLILKHYCLDSLKQIDLKSDMRPKLINNIINLLNENKI